MPWHHVEKEYYDYTDDIEAVSIHYVCTPPGSDPDWDKQRVTRYMPLVKGTSQGKAQAGATPRLRKKVLKLPSQLGGAENGEGSNRYLLHYYFEICQDGSRRYSPLYTEEVVTNGQVPQDNAPSAQKEKQYVVS